MGTQTPLGPGGLTACISWQEKHEGLLAECLAAAYAQWKAQKRAEVPLSPNRLSRLEGVHQCLQLNLDKIENI